MNIMKTTLKIILFCLFAISIQPLFAADKNQGMFEVFPAAESLGQTSLNTNSRTSLAM